MEAYHSYEGAHFFVVSILAEGNIPSVPNYMSPVVSFSANLFETPLKYEVVSAGKFAGNMGYGTLRIYWDWPFITDCAKMDASWETAFTEEGMINKMFMGDSSKALTADLLSSCRLLTDCLERRVTAPKYFEALATLIWVQVLVKVFPFASGETINREERQLAEAIRDRILNNPESFYSVPELARFAGTNEQRVQAAFQSVMGTTIFKFTRQVKLDLAKHLLLTTNYTLETIADLTGYSEGSNLAHSFKQMVGMTPGEFKRRG